MLAIISRAVAVTGNCILLVACASVITIPTDQPLLPLPDSAALLIEPGPVSYSVNSGEHLGQHGCTLSYKTYWPAQHQSKAMVVLAHGFMRDQTTMEGWAAHWASYGVPVTVMDLCNSSWLNGRHERNAADLVSLVEALHRGPVLYAGFSAGGLAAYLAATADPATLAYLGLDSVESGAHAGSVTPISNYPALFVVAEPSACNAHNNILDAVSAAQEYTALRVRNSTHCHFENPYDARCEWVCGSVKPPEASTALINTIRSLATAWILKQALEHPLASNVLDSAKAESDDWGQRIEVLH